MLQPTLRATVEIMDAFSRAVEAMANMPLRGKLPSNTEIDNVATMSKTFTRTAETVDPVSGRQLPTQEEIAKIVEAFKR
jgi:uncharacterized protein YjgD (DUF1641 family)